jgi:hypothetical protein
MTKYYRVTGMLTEDEYAFVKLVSELMQCSLARAVGVCVIWARTNKDFQGLLRTLKETKEKGGEGEWRG